MAFTSVCYVIIKNQPNLPKYNSVICEGHVWKPCSQHRNRPDMYKNLVRICYLRKKWLYWSSC